MLVLFVPNRITVFNLLPLPCYVLPDFVNRPLEEFLIVGEEFSNIPAVVHLVGEDDFHSFSTSVRKFSRGSFSFITISSV